MEAKGKDKIEAEFFGKFILCSNNEDNFIKIDAAEERFWVRKITKFKLEDTNPAPKTNCRNSGFSVFPEQLKYFHTQPYPDVVLSIPNQNQSFT